MKILLILILILNMFLVSCAKPSGELVNIPDGLESAASEYWQSRDFKLKGLSVRQYPNEVYLISTELEYIGTLQNEPKKRSENLIAQKGSRPDKSVFWNIQFANKNNLDLFGIK